MSKRTDTGFNGLSRKPKNINDIWIVKFPYKENGGFYKIRPAIVIGYEDENIVVQKITSQRKQNQPIAIVPKQEKECYLTPDIEALPEFLFIRRIGKKKGTEQKGAYVKNYQTRTHKKGKRNEKGNNNISNSTSMLINNTK